MQNLTNQIFDREKLATIRRWWIDIDKINLLLVVGLILFGFIMTVSSSTAIAKRIEVDKFYFIKKQFMFIIIGISIIIIISSLEYNQIKKFSYIGIVIAFILLISVFLFGSSAKGSKRWITLMGFTLQPSELAKTFFVMANALLLDKFSNLAMLKRYTLSFGLFFLLVALVAIQPDIGMSFSFTILWLLQIFLDGIWLFLIIILALFSLIGAIIAYITFPHVRERLTSFISSESGKNYQAERSIDGFVNGGLFGTGPGNGVVKSYIPDAHTDFIFAVIGEEYGIISCILLIFIFLYLITRIINKIRLENDRFIYLALSGLIFQFAIQLAINIAVSLKLLPTKGMTLPFISYGGSSMIAMSICFGLILAFTKKTYHKNLDYGNVNLIVSSQIKD